MKISILVVALGLCGCASPVRSSQEKDSCSKFADDYLRNLNYEENRVEIIERSVDGEKIDNWSDLLRPTFPIGIDFNGGVRAVIQESKSGRKIAVFVLRTSENFKKGFPAFDRFSISGVLRSEAQTYYSAMATDEVLIVLLCEQQQIPSDSPLLTCLIQALDAKHKPMNQ